MNIYGHDLPITCAPTIHMKGQCAGCKTTVTACEHPEHNPPGPLSHAAWSQVVTSWRCPGCGYSFTFAVGRSA